ncbi:hypothetical protein BJV77DRAFT_1018587, partial [Russula vinacea]
MPACHCLIRPFDELEKGMFLARDRRTTLQEADGMRSSEDDLANLKEELRPARESAISARDPERQDEEQSVQG